MGLKCQGGRRDVGHKDSALMPSRVGKQGMPRQAHVNGCKGGGVQAWVGACRLQL